MERRVIAASSSSALIGIRQTGGGGFMKTLTLTLAAAALALGATALSANAQQLGAGHAQLQNATPIVKQAACRGFGARCGPGFVWTCGPYGRCWCRPCV
jgi:uncharacterized lipoprotein